MVTKLALAKAGFKIGLVISLIAAAGFLFWQNKALIEKGARQAVTILQQDADLADKETRIEDLARQRDAAEAIAAREKARAIEIRAQTKDLENEIDKLRKNPEVAAWGAARMPDAVFHLLLMAEPDDRPD